MRSKDDPILDAQALCQEKPHSESELRDQLSKLGWAMPVINSILANKGYGYLELSAEGLFIGRNGTVKEVHEIILNHELEEGAKCFKS